jgi:hypothetical protein
MLVRTRTSIFDALGDRAVRFVNTWPHDLEIDEHKQVVIFYSADSLWMVGYSFEQLAAAARNPLWTPGALRQMVENALADTQRK